MFYHNFKYTNDSPLTNLPSILTNVVSTDSYVTEITKYDLTDGLQKTLEVLTTPSTVSNKPQSSVTVTKPLGINDISSDISFGFRLSSITQSSNTYNTTIYGLFGLFFNPSDSASDYPIETLYEPDFILDYQELYNNDNQVIGVSIGLSLSGNNISDSLTSQGRVNFIVPGATKFSDIANKYFEVHLTTVSNIFSGSNICCYAYIDGVLMGSFILATGYDGTTSLANITDISAIMCLMNIGFTDTISRSFTDVYVNSGTPYGNINITSNALTFNTPQNSNWVPIPSTNTDQESLVSGDISEGSYVTSGPSGSNALLSYPYSENSYYGIMQKYELYSFTPTYSNCSFTLSPTIYQKTTNFDISIKQTTDLNYNTFNIPYQAKGHEYIFFVNNYYLSCVDLTSGGTTTIAQLSYEYSLCTSIDDKTLAVIGTDKNLYFYNIAFDSSVPTRQFYNYTPEFTPTYIQFLATNQIAIFGETDMIVLDISTRSIIQSATLGKFVVGNNTYNPVGTIGKTGAPSILYNDETYGGSFAVCGPSNTWSMSSSQSEGMQDVVYISNIYKNHIITASTDYKTISIPSLSEATYPTTLSSDCTLLNDDGSSFVIPTQDNFAIWIGEQIEDTTSYMFLCTGGTIYSYILNIQKRTVSLIRKDIIDSTLSGNIINISYSYYGTYLIIGIEGKGIKFYNVNNIKNTVPTMFTPYFPNALPDLHFSPYPNAIPKTLYTYDGSETSYISQFGDMLLISPPTFTS